MNLGTLNQVLNEFTLEDLGKLDDAVKDAEVLAILLHEVGHNFDASIYPMMVKMQNTICFLAVKSPSYFLGLNKIGEMIS